MAYSIQTDAEQIFGANNISEWLDINEDGNSSTKAARWSYLRILADAIIDAKLATSPYLTSAQAPTSTDTPTLIKLVSATLTGVISYESRGIEDYSPQSGQPIHKLMVMRTRAEGILDALCDGRLKIEAKGMYP